MYTNQFNDYIKLFQETFAIGVSFDITERKVSLGDKVGRMYYLEGFVKGDTLERVLSEILKITKKEMEAWPDAASFIQFGLSYPDAKNENDNDKLVTAVLSGLTVMVVEGFADAIVLDLRSYPVRGVAEPEKEKSLRGPKDGLVETLLFNTSMIRRRIRDPRLIFKTFTVGTSSRTDVCLCYMDGLAKPEDIAKLTGKIEGIKQDALTVGDQSLVEAIGKSQWLNPFPKVRYTQRPDVIAAHLMEGRVVLLVDNSPTAIMIPTNIFDFFQDTDDYYFPILTGNYFRFLRIINMILVIFLTPVYLLIAEQHIPTPEIIAFFIPDEGYAIPLFWQFIILELAIDGLKLASLSTPSSLGMSLSVIGALILGEFAVGSGWFIPQTILCMAVLALAGFTQPSIELGYAIKFMRILMLIGAILFGVPGAIIALVLNLIVLAKTKSIIGTSYLYPLVPFDWKILRRLLFRTRKPKKEKS